MIVYLLLGRERILILIDKNSRIILFCVLAIVLAVSIMLIPKKEGKNASNTTKSCINGHASRWAGACICNNPALYFGQYCDEKPVKDCYSNKDCPSEHFCLLINNEGKCHKANATNRLKINSISFALSDSLISYDNAAPFCSALKGGYRPVSRKDFHCNGMGAACLDRNLTIKLQEQYGNLGFFWLEKTENSNNAYYADLNDGTIYYTNKDNFKFNQVLCIRRENE